MFPEEFREGRKLRPRNGWVDSPHTDTSATDLGVDQNLFHNPPTPQSIRAEADTVASPAVTVPLTGNAELCTPRSSTRKRVVRSPSLSSLPDNEIPDGTSIISYTLLSDRCAEY